jgi:multicomponent K+:H+ antiporter subunit D
VAALFALMTKVGIYVLLRLWTLLFSSGASAGFGGPVLLYGGLATLALGAAGLMASMSVGRIAGHSLIVSSGTLLGAVGMANVAVTSGALYYLASSTLTIGAFFLLIELVERAQDPAAAVLSVTMEVYGDDEDEEEEEEEEVGTAFPGTLAVLGICFGCCGVLLAGLPPLSGFIAKFALITALFNPGSALGAPEAGGVISATAWVLTALLILSGFAALLAMTRAGIRSFWAPLEVIVPRVLVIEIAPVLALLVLTFFLSVQGGPVMRYMDATAQALHAPAGYVRGVLSAAPQTTPATVEARR